jgi:hypothetical protein
MRAPAFARATSLGVLVALVLPAAAAAHIRSGVVAVDEVASAAALPPRVHAALVVHVDRSDRALRLAVRPGHSAVVLGAHGEPALRLGRRRPSAVWHDPRTAAARWTIPLLVDGAPATIVGTTRQVPRPSLRPWLALAGGVLSPVLLLALRRVSRRLAVVLSVVAAGATLVVALAFALAATASAATWLTSFDEVLIVAGALVVVFRGRSPADTGALAVAGLVAVFAGGLKSAVLFHGVVLSGLPPELVRAAVVTALASGAAALAHAVALYDSARLRA